MTSNSITARESVTARKIATECGGEQHGTRGGGGYQGQRWQCQQADIGGYSETGVVVLSKKNIQ